MATTVPELLAKKRKRDEAWVSAKATAALEARKKASESRKAVFKRAEAYVKEYRTQVNIAAYSDAAIPRFVDDYARPSKP